MHLNINESKPKQFGNEKKDVKDSDWVNSGWFELWLKLAKREYQGR